MHHATGLVHPRGGELEPVDVLFNADRGPSEYLSRYQCRARGREGDRVLDMGTGSGINAVLAASNGAHVVAVDINPRVLQAARSNAERNEVGDRIEVRHSNVFSAVKETFDLVVFDPPFRWFAPRDLLEAAMTDENYQAMTAFLRQAGRHLSPAGRMLVFFGTSGDLGYLKQLMAAERLCAKVITHQGIVRDDQQIDYFTFRLN